MTRKAKLGSRRQRLSLWISVLALVVCAMAAAATNWPGIRPPLLVAASVLAVLVGSSEILWRRLHERRLNDTTVTRRNVANLAGAKGRLPTIADVPLSALRVHPEVIHVPYIRCHAKELEVKRILDDSKPVLIVGSSMVGKTRLAAEVAKQFFAQHATLIPSTSISLDELDNANLTIDSTIVWLDDLDRFLNGGGLTAGLIDRLAAKNVIIATIRAREWDRFQPIDDIRPPEWDVLARFAVVTLKRDDLISETSMLEEAVHSAQVRERILQTGIGEYVGAARHVADRLRIGPQSNPLGDALVRGCADWHLTGIGMPCPAKMLRDLASARLSDRLRVRIRDDEAYNAALEWATTDINPTVSLLEEGGDGYGVYDYALDIISGKDSAIPEATWNLAVDNANSDDLLSMGYQALINYKNVGVAERAWTRAADTGMPEAMFNLGLFFRDQGDPAGSERWWLRAADAGFPTAMNNLGAFYAERDEVDGALIWYQRAFDAGTVESMFNMSLLEERRGDLARAEEFVRKAAAAGNVGAMTNLGSLLNRRGEYAESFEWSKRAADAGDPIGMTNFASVLYERGKDSEAISWWIRAADQGDTRAMLNLGVVYNKRKERPQMMRWWTMAADAGNVDAMYSLAATWAQEGDTPAAEAMYRRAANANHPPSMSQIGRLLYLRRDVDQAEEWWKKAADLGDLDAMSNLGNMLNECGRVEESISWSRKAADGGNALGMFNLGVVLGNTGDSSGSEHWLRRAADLDHDDAMWVLGLLLNDRDDVDEAEVWWTRAAEKENTDAMNSLGVLLDLRGDRSNAMQWWRKASENDDPTAMCNLGRALYPVGETREAEEWWLFAAELGNGWAKCIMGAVSFDRGDIDEAENWWTEAQQSDDLEPSMGVWLAFLRPEDENDRDSSVVLELLGADQRDDGERNGS